MALQDEVTNRYSAQFLASLTNPQAPHVTTPDIAKLGLAATDVEGDFIRELGLTFDLTLKEHVSVAVEGVIAKLRTRNGQGGELARRGEQAYLDNLRALRFRADPKSTSELEPTPESAGGVTPKPAFDTPEFRDYVPGAASSAWSE